MLFPNGAFVTFISPAFYKTQFVSTVRLYRKATVSGLHTISNHLP